MRKSNSFLFNIIINNTSKHNSLSVCFTPKITVPGKHISLRSYYTQALFSIIWNAQALFSIILNAQELFLNFFVILRLNTVLTVKCIHDTPSLTIESSTSIISEVLAVNKYHLRNQNFVCNIWLTHFLLAHHAISIDDATTAMVVTACEISASLILLKLINSSSIHSVLSFFRCVTDNYF